MTHDSDNNNDNNNNNSGSGNDNDDDNGLCLLLVFGVFLSQIVGTCLFVSAIMLLFTSRLFAGVMFL